MSIGFKYLKVAVAFGTGIAGINIFNIKKSPIYQRDHKTDPLVEVRLGLLSIFKGGMYGVFMPINIIYVTRQFIENSPEIGNHFVPRSSGGKKS